MKNKKIIFPVIIVAMIIVVFLLIVVGFATGAIPQIVKDMTVQKEISNDNAEGEVSSGLPEVMPTIPEASSLPIFEQEDDKDELNDQKALEMIISDKIKLSDIYTVEGENAVFSIFDPDADNYKWEYYDENWGWQSVDKFDSSVVEFQLDEFYRSISTLTLPATNENNGIKVRCIINDNEEKISEAQLYVIDEIKSISTEDYKAEVGEWLNISEIPVDITFIDNTQMTVLGLQNLYFCYEVSFSEDEKKNNNEITKTITTVTKEEKFFKPEAGDNKISMRYRINKTVLDADINIIGIDKTPPEIESYLLDEYSTVSKLEKPVSISVMITAKDNCTSNENLKYYFCPAEEEANADSFTSENKQTYETLHNGIFAVYVMDEAGNMAKEEFEVILIDEKSPEILSVSLAYPDMSQWFESNTITVEAKDKSSLSYNFSCNGVDSGYISGNSYAISHNGTWTVYVKDVAGNISSRDIEVTNIDNKAPVIVSIGTSNRKKDSSQSTASNTTVAITDPQSIPSPIIIQGPAGSPGKTGSAGKDGKDGNDGNTSFIRYSAYANGANMTATANENTKYIGTYVGKTASSNPLDYTWSRYRGEDGKDGSDGKSSFIRYSATANGENMTTVPNENTRYIGTYIGKTASNNPLDYTWTKYKDVIMIYSESDNTLDFIQ